MLEIENMLNKLQDRLLLALRGQPLPFARVIAQETKVIIDKY